MIRNLIALISALAVLLMLTLTNPGLKSHKLIIREKASALINRGVYQKQLIINKLLKEGISRTNYVLFSTTNLDYKGQKDVVGYGVLSNVFLNGKLDRVLVPVTTESVR